MLKDCLLTPRRLCNVVDRFPVELCVPSSLSHTIGPLRSTKKKGKMAEMDRVPNELVMNSLEDKDWKRDLVAHTHHLVGPFSGFGGYRWT
jgi:hypothetical protein